METTQKRRLSFKDYLGLILVGFAGQIAWAIENNYINLWVYSQAPDAKYIAWMTSASAAVATLTTFFMGVLSDRLGKRKIFVSAGYCIWGVSVFLFGVMSYRNMASLFAGGILLAVGLANTIVDCIMTFFGSTANDACFNAFVTDVTEEKKRALVESILSVLPLLALGGMMLVGLALGVPGAIQEGESQAAYAERIEKPWFLFFLILGAFVTAIGALSFFLLPKDEAKPNRDEPYFKALIYGFRPSSVKKQPLFYITLLAFLFFNVAIDAFLPYYMVYLQNPASSGGLGFSGNTFYAGMGIMMGISSVLVILFGAFMEKIGKMKLLLPAILLLSGGALGLYFSKSFAAVATMGTILMFGYLLGTAILGAELRSLTPKDEVGEFQGVRMVFTVMLPMILGSNLSLLFFQSQAKDEITGSASSPDRSMFLVALVAALLSLGPAIWLLVAERKKAASSAKQED